MLKKKKKQKEKNTHFQKHSSLKIDKNQFLNDQTLSLKACFKHVVYTGNSLSADRSSNHQVRNSHLKLCVFGKAQNNLLYFMLDFEINLAISAKLLTTT